MCKPENMEEKRNINEAGPSLLKMNECMYTFYLKVSSLYDSQLKSRKRGKPLHNHLYIEPQRKVSNGKYRDLYQ